MSKENNDLERPNDDVPSEKELDESSKNDDTDEGEDSEVVDDLEIEKLVPKMEVNCAPEESECIVGDDQLMDLYKEILGNSRNDRSQTDDLLANFVNMVMNDGESSSASKEAIVNLMKVKSDISDKMTKIADLMTRIKLKDRDTFPRYLASQQNNKIVFDGNKRDFLKKIQKRKKKNDKQKP